MSDWWARKLAGGAPTPPPRQGSTPPLPQPAPRPTQVPQQYAPEGAVQQPPQYPQPAQQNPDEEIPLTQALATKTYDRIPDKASGQLQNSSTCPSCQSGNYLVTNTGGRRHEHCHDCGYPVVQAGSGMGALGGSGIIATGGTHKAQSPVYSQQIGS